LMGHHVGISRHRYVHGPKAIVEPQLLGLCGDDRKRLDAERLQVLAGCPQLGDLPR
jgi:fructoselysine-6-P-deglycase FrlB-like protein